jgi:hypothetical protein
MEMKKVVTSGYFDIEDYFFFFLKKNSITIKVREKKKQMFGSHIAFSAFIPGF